jgi:hypothetical protein
MVGASIVVILYTPCDRSLIAPGDDGVNQAIRAAVLEVILSETET